MELTEADLKMIKWLRRQHAGWRSTRVITAVGSAIMVGWSGLAWLHGESAIAVVALGCMGVFGLSYSLGCWAGRPEISLLLKLVEHEQGGDQS